MADRHLVRGILAGVAGGLAAAWVMNEFSGTLGKKLSDAVETPAEKRLLDMQSDGEDATMKAADKVVETVTGGRHLSHEQREIGGPIVHYSMGALMGGLYGGLSEYCDCDQGRLRHNLRRHPLRYRRPARRARHEAGSMAHEYPVSSLANPLASHLIYGATTELVRRVVREIL